MAIRRYLEKTLYLSQHDTEKTECNYVNRGNLLAKDGSMKRGVVASAVQLSGGGLKGDHQLSPGV
jgi:hypothetical protein